MGDIFDIFLLQKCFYFLFLTLFWVQEVLWYNWFLTGSWLHLFYWNDCHFLPMASKGQRPPSQQEVQRSDERRIYLPHLLSEVDYCMNHKMTHHRSTMCVPFTQLHTKDRLLCHVKVCWMNLLRHYISRHTQSSILHNTTHKREAMLVKMYNALRWQSFCW